MIRLAPILATLLVAVALLSACGDDGDGSVDQARAPSTTVAAHPDSAAGGEGTATAPKPGYGKLVQRQGKAKTTAASRFTPCNLVTKAEAQQILDASLEEPKEAPLGPTCIYRSRDGRSFVTLAVQTQSLRAATKALPAVRRLHVADRQAACSSAGRPTLWVSVAKRRLLTVAGPCDTAQQFATAAIGRLDD